MKMAFLPGKLLLDQLDNNTYVVTLQGKEILHSRSKKAAVAKFNELRAQLIKQFPTRDLTDEDKQQLLHREIADTLVRHNSLGGRTRSKTAAKTRTFGG